MSHDPIMKTFMAVLLIAIGAAPELWPQAVPSATGPRSFGIGGTFKYALRYSQMMNFYSAGQGSEQIATVSGDLDYRNDSERKPFSAVFGGGYLWDLTGRLYGHGFFENLNISQGLAAKDWNVSVEDQLGYSNQTLATPFSGQPGTGEPITQPTPNPQESSVFAPNAIMIDNNLWGNYSHRITTGTTFTAGGRNTLLRYPNSTGIDTDSYQGNSGLTWRLNARNSIETGYYYTRYTYSGYDLALTSNAALTGYIRRWTRHFSSTLSAGPQWVSSSNTLIEPGELTYQANGGATYTMRSGSVGLNYTHAFFGGSGFLLGSTVDNATASLQHEFGRQWVIECTGGYLRTEQLGGRGIISGKLAGGQVTRHIGRRFSIFANYTAEMQSYSAAISGNALNGLWQLFSVGAGLTPPAIHLGR